ncbi:MAG: hypothetical protein ACRD4Q_03455 [Candidatus Acidiferrales bacterium]
MKWNEVKWTPASAGLGAGALYEGRELVNRAVLSDRRADGGGIAYLLRIMPPAGKLVRAIAVARSDENVYLLEGGYCTKRATRFIFPDYMLNP